MMNKKLFGLIVGAAAIAGASAPALADGRYYDRDDRDGRYEDRYDRYDDRYDDRYARTDRYDREGYGNRYGGYGISFERQLARDPLLRRAAFRYFDTDRNGRLGPNERWRAERAFVRLADVNRDGRIGRREYDWARERLVRRDYAWR